jgi:hypothetical protein
MKIQVAPDCAIRAHGKVWRAGEVFELADNHAQALIEAGKALAHDEKPKAKRTK